MRAEGVILEDSSMDKVEMLAEHSEIEMEGQDISNDSNQQRVLITFQDVIDDSNTMTQQILETVEVDSENLTTHSGTGIQVMEIDDSQQEMSEVVDTVMKEVIEEPDMEVSQTDSLPRIEVTEVAENEEEDVKKTEPDTEAVSEDELPNEAAAKVKNKIFYITFSTLRGLVYVNQ